MDGRAGGEGPAIFLWRRRARTASMPAYGSLHLPAVLAIMLESAVFAAETEGTIQHGTDHN